MRKFTSDAAVLTIISLSVVIAILGTAYIFLIKKDYGFLVEVPCDPEKEICGYRDCSTGECPPNELEYYKTFLVPAEDFPLCSDDSCLTECESGAIECEVLECDPEWEECVSE